MPRKAIFLVVSLIITISTLHYYFHPTFRHRRLQYPSKIDVSETGNLEAQMSPQQLTEEQPTLPNTDIDADTDADLDFESVPGYFASFSSPTQRVPIDTSKFDHNALVNFSSWKELYDAIPRDNDTTSYKLLILARHGQGYHNAAIERYGQAQWDEYWSFLDGDEFGSWFDAKLTPLGREQVRSTGADVLWPIVDALGVLPHKYFSSPMRRCLETFMFSWSEVYERWMDNGGHKSSTVAVPNVVENNVIENLRETLGEHTCDERVDHSVALREYQDAKLPSGQIVHWVYEDGYPEHDQLWEADHREDDDEMKVRVRAGLKTLFAATTADDRFISLTCHDGVIRNVLANLKHPGVLNLDVGKVVCVVVKITRKGRSVYINN